jgi:hypothetical protein
MSAILSLEIIDASRAIFSSALHERLFGSTGPARQRAI